MTATEPEVLTTTEGRRLAYDHCAGAGPAVMFLGGFRSDMTGTKARYLEDWARLSGRAFLRFDYSGHGASAGDFLDGCIGDWLADARAMLARLEGPVILVGSSMGGWLALMLARELPSRIAGLVTVAAAPDFTEDGKWARLDAEERRKLEAEGVVHLPSDYGEPYPITRHLIQEGREHLILRSPLTLPMPVRILHGTADTDVPPERSLAVLNHATGPDIDATLVKGADHRFSDDRCLSLVARAVEEVMGAVGRHPPYLTRRGTR